MARTLEVWIGLLVAAALLGCGGSAAVAPLKHGEVKRGRWPSFALAGGTPSDGATHLAMYIDAGSRDGGAPHYAVLAAHMLAERVGRGAQAQAFPDGIEVITVCDDGLRACTKRLARGLALREPGDAAIARVLAELKNAERNVRAADPARQADELALRAMLGDEAPRFLPLDLRAAKSDRTTFEGVRAFIAGAFGRPRMRVVASGPVGWEEMKAAMIAAFAKAPLGTQERAWRSLPVIDESPGLRVGVDSTAMVSLVLRADDVIIATRAANELRDELLRSKVARSVTGHVANVRFGALAILRAYPNGSDVAPIVSRAGYSLVRMRREGVGIGELLPLRDEPAVALRRIGMNFMAGGGPVGSDVLFGLGIGVLVRGARADRVGEKDPDAALRESEQARLAEALRGGVALAQPELDGEVGEHAVSATLRNGSRIAVHEVSSDQVAIAVRLGAGAKSDPPAQHGRAALLASAMTVACAGRSPAALRTELASIGAVIEPFVSADTLGITLRARSEHTKRAVALAVECALAPSLARGDVTRARLELRERLGLAPRDSALPRGGSELRAQVARLHSVDRTPGELAPWGAMSTLASVDERALSELLERALRGPSTSVAIVGTLGKLGGEEAAMNAEAAAMIAARRMTRLASDPAPAAKALATKAPSAPRAKTNGKQAAVPASPTLPPQAVEALLVWSASCHDAPAADGSVVTASDAARAFAAAMSAALGSAELNVPWLDGDCAAGVAWAALLARGPAERIAAVQAIATRAAARIAPKAVLEAADHAARKQLGAAGTLAGHAARLAEAPWAAPVQPARAATAPAALIQRLRAAPARALPVE